METGSQQSQSASQDGNVLLSPSSELSIDSQCPVRAVTARLEASSEKQALAVGSYRGRNLRNPQLTQFINGIARFWKAQNCEESLEMLSMTEQDPGRVTQRGKRAEKTRQDCCCRGANSHSYDVSSWFPSPEMTWQSLRRPQMSYTSTDLCSMA